MSLNNSLLSPDAKDARQAKARRTAFIFDILNYSNLNRSH
jgi:hypothetical protein